jgi:predicted dienelactone hydrolase
MTTRRQIIRCAIAGPMLLTLGCASDSISDPKYRSAFYVKDLDWHDAQRKRSVPVRFYLPKKDISAGKIPLVVFSHGIGGSRYGYSYLGRAWAKEGFASLHLQHVGSDRTLWISGSPFDLVSRLHQAARDAEAIARAEDLRFALDQAFSGELGHFFDADRIIAAGHSYGANTVLLAAGARVERQGQLLDLRDNRLRAAIIISAPPFYGELSPHRILDSVQIPSLHITATHDVIHIPGYYSGATDRIRIFDNVGSQHKILAVFAGGSHSIFTDRPGTGGLLLNPKVKNATSKLTSAFLRSVLNGDGEDLHDWPIQHSGILSRFTATML